MKNIRHCA